VPNVYTVRNWDMLTIDLISDTNLRLYRRLLYVNLDIQGF